MPFGRRNGRTLARFRVSFPVAVVLLFIGAYLVAALMQAIQLIR